MGQKCYLKSNCNSHTQSGVWSQRAIRMTFLLLTSVKMWVKYQVTFFKYTLFQLGGGREVVSGLPSSCKRERTHYLSIPHPSQNLIACNDQPILIQCFGIKIAHRQSRKSISNPRIHPVYQIHHILWNPPS